jgi:predicted ArsR family transcriptional regulator
VNHWKRAAAELKANRHAPPPGYERVEVVARAMGVVVAHARVILADLEKAGQVDVKPGVALVHGRACPVKFYRLRKPTHSRRDKGKSTQPPV